MSFILNAHVIEDTSRREDLDAKLRRWADEIIPAIESRYGPRNPAFKLVGVEFKGVTPHTFFPGEFSWGLIIIRLGTKAIDSDAKALFQLAHECVHLLDPVTHGNAPVLEEGLATINSIEFAHRLDPLFSNNDRKYEMSAAVTEEAMKINRDFVRKLREAGIAFGDMSPEMILSECPGLNAGIAETLCTKFQEWNPFIELSRIQSRVPIQLSFGSTTMHVGGNAGLIG